MAGTAGEISKPGIAEAVAGKERTGAPSTKAAERAAKIRKQVREARTARSATEGLRRPESDKKAQANQLIERNVGIDRTSRNTEEAARYNRAKEAQTTVRTLLEKGFDGLTTAQQRKATDSVRDIFTQVPEIADVWAANPTEVTAIIQSKLKDAEFVTQLSDAWAEVTGAANEIGDEASPAQKKLLEAQAKFDKVDADLGISRARKDTNDALLREFNSDLSTGAKGAKQQQIEDLQRDKPDLGAQKDEMEADKIATDAQIARLQRQLAGNKLSGKESKALEDQLVVAEDKAKTLRLELRGINGKLNNLTELQQTKLDLQNKKAEIEAERVALEGQKALAVSELSLAKATSLNASDKRTIDEETFVGDLEGAISLAAFRYLEKQLTDAEAADEVVRTKELAEAKTQIDRALITGLKTSYGRNPERYQKGLIRKRWDTKLGNYNEAFINTDFNVFLTSGDTNRLLEGVLRSAYDPRTGERYMTDDQIMEFTGNELNKAVVEAMSKKAVETLISAKAKIGGMTEQQAEILAHSEWGAAAITAKAATNPEVRQKINEVKAATGAKTDEEALAKMGSKNLLLLLLSLFGTAAIATMAIASGAAKE